MATKKMTTLAADFAGQPILVAKDMESQFEALLTGIVGHEDFAKLEAIAAGPMCDDFWNCDEWEAQYRPYNVDENGILFVPIRGMLLHNFPYALGNWATGYIYIQKAIERGLDDMNVKGIALTINSPGGMVAGCFEAVDKVYARRDEKPIRAFAHEGAYSAAYAWASVASAGIVVSRTGGVGSIGIITSHFDLSKMYEQMGVKETFIFAGKHKKDGNSAEPLSDDAKARIQARVDEMYDVFVSTVARNRGMKEQAIRDTEALTYTATQAVSVGLADSIGPLDDAVAQFCVDLSTPEDDEGDTEMSNKTDNAAVVEKAVDEKALADARAAGVAEGEAAATARIGAILGSDEAKGREDLANHFAFKTSMKAEDAVAALAVSPKKEAAKPAVAQTTEGGFEAAMANGNPEVGAEGGEEANGDALEDLLALAASAGMIRKRA